jgi:mono/diheme cytochrome c family protein
MVTARGILAAVVLLGASAAPLRADSGSDIFKQQCAKCHGASGASDTGIAKTKKIPPIAGDAKIAAMSDADLAKQILSAEKHPAKIKQLSADDAASVAAYVKGLASGR